MAHDERMVDGRALLRLADRLQRSRERVDASSLSSAARSRLRLRLAEIAELAQSDLAGASSALDEVVASLDRRGIG